MDYFRTSSYTLSSENLPIHKFRNEILYLIENNSVVIVVGPTGSGKTTQIPKFLLEQGWTGIACTQPRKLSAIAMANRVSQELGLEVGSTIGYTVRFDNCTSEKTICRFITDGMLFRECLHDPLLSKYSIIMIDEAHERTLHTDLLLALIKKILPRRPELRVIISSATIEAEAFKKYFTLPRIDLLSGKKVYGPIKAETESFIPQTEFEVDQKTFLPSERFVPKIISIEGRVYPIEINFLQSGPSDRMIQKDEVICDGVCRLVEKINTEIANGPGDILVFLSGRSEIEKCYEILSAQFSNNPSEDTTELMNLFRKKSKTSSQISKSKPFSLDLLQLYSGMNQSDQLKVFDPPRPNVRKVILSTNIAEASVTIDGVVYVVDSGRVKVKFYNSGEEKMITIPISKASADQRAGRAGRTQPGKVFRLYTQEFFESLQMPRHTIPDLQLSKLTSIMLQLKAMRIDDLIEFDFLSPLPERNVKEALLELERLCAIDPLTGGLSDPLGIQMAQLPLEPDLGHFLLKASEFNCPREGAALAAMLTIQNQNDLSTFLLPNEYFSRVQRRFWVEEGDHLTLLNVFMSYLANSETSVKFCQKYGLVLKNLNLANRLYKNLLSYLNKIFKIPTDRTTKMSTEEISINLRKALISAYPLNVAKSDEVRACYVSLTKNDQSPLNIHPNSVLFKRLPPLIIYGNELETSKKFLKFVTLIESDWLTEIHPKLYKYIRK